MRILFVSLVLSALSVPALAAREDETMKLENSFEAIGLFLNHCARPIVADLPAPKGELKRLDDFESRIRFGEAARNVRVNHSRDITVFDAHNECNLGLRSGDPEMLRQAFSKIFDPADTGFRRARFERDGKGGFRVEYFRRDAGRVLTFRARVSAFEIEGQSQAQFVMREVRTASDLAR